MKAIKVTPDSIAVVDVDPSLNGLQAEVGGNLEAIRVPNGHAYINEDGRQLGLPNNHNAVRILPWGGIVGNMIILGNGEDGKEADVPDRIVAAIGLL